MVTYRPRIIDAELADRLLSAGAVVIQGPKACGKTETARRVAGSAVFLDIDANARQAATLAPERVLEGETPRLIDEWQLAPEIWNHVRHAIDARGQAGQFILTGSLIPAEDAVRHSGAGRISRLMLRPMTLFETGRSTGDISIASMLAGEVLTTKDPGLTIGDIAENIAVGGWPRHVDLPVRAATRSVRDYVEEITHTDVATVDGVRRDPARVARLMASLARNVATYASNNTLAADTGAMPEQLDRHTVSDYLTALERLFIIEDQPAWAPHLRSRARLRSASKRHFVDPSLAVAALGASPDRLLDDLEFLGFLFESMVIRDLRVYAQASDASVLQYRDGTGLEVDAIVEVADGEWAAFEIKLGGALVDEGAENLLRFAERVDTERSGAPAVLGVITASGVGFKRPDGILIIPIGALGP